MSEGKFDLISLAVTGQEKNTKKGLDITLKSKRKVKVSREKVAEFEAWIGNINKV